MKIGILAVQGAFIEHEKIIKGLGADCIEIRKCQDSCNCRRTYSCRTIQKPDWNVFSSRTYIRHKNTQIFFGYSERI